MTNLKGKKSKKSPRKNDYKAWKLEVIDFLEKTYVEDNAKMNLMSEENNFDEETLKNLNSLEFVNNLFEDAKKWNLDTDNTTFDSLVAYKASLD